MVIYFISGLIAGVSASSYLIGKELFVLHKKNTLQEKKLMRLRKLNHQLLTKNSLLNNPEKINLLESNDKSLVQ
jgi:hypothetical protein